MKSEILFKEKNKVITTQAFINFIKSDYYCPFEKKGNDIYIAFNGFAFFLNKTDAEMFERIIPEIKNNADTKIIKFTYDKKLNIKQDICFEMIKQKNKGIIYIYETQGLYKIGYTQNKEGRFKRYVTENPYTVSRKLEIEVNSAYEIEQKLHKLYKPKRFRGEWYELTDCDLLDIEFLLSGESAMYIKNPYPKFSLLRRLEIENRSKDNNL